jgi:hypothetical protein
MAVDALGLVFYGRISTGEYQDAASPRAWQPSQSSNADRSCW